MGKFFNPYNFIPTPPRSGDFPRELGDSKPVGHHCIIDDRWNGVIAVTMTAVTPLLIPGGEVRVDSKKHRTFRTRLSGGRVDIPTSSVKGMIRSAFEAITNSRFGEFSSRHQDPVAFRQTAREGIEAFPAIVMTDGRVRVLMGDVPFPSRPSQSGYAQPSVLPAAWVLTEDLDRNQIRHGDYVECDVQELQHRNGFKYLKATNVSKLTDSGIGRWGLVYRTGVTSLNRSRKHYERVFLLDGTNDPVFPLTDEIKNRWRALISDARELHEGDPNFADYTRRPKRPDEDHWRELGPDSLMYVRLKWNVETSKWSLDEAQPVAISRQLHPDAPAELLHPSLQPPKSFEEFSPADRVFGWVNSGATNERHSAYAGSVRLSSIECLSDQAIEQFKLPQTLPVLDRPKPEQSRFYLGESSNGTILPLKDGLSKQEIRYLKDGRRSLRGRKVYPNQNRQPQWNHQTKGPQNRSFEDQVRVATEFGFTLNVRNLSTIELGALLVVLDLDNSLNDGSKRCLSLGGARPFGFGSVSLRVDWESTTICRGAETIRACLDFRQPTAETGLARQAIVTFLELVKGRSFFEAFRIATKGFEATIPVHYPRIEPASGEDMDTVNWFKINEENGRRTSLPPMSASGESSMSTYPATRENRGARPRS